MTQPTHEPFKIEYTNKDGIHVTCYGSKHAMEELADHLENKGILCKVSKTEEKDE